uniref:X1.A.C4.1 n=1 Tax=Schmidtea mediterranea TaxID=79327 RepID=V9XMR8_SCHMD|nr:X1.A.C4.1 [Schmidtea mediterranea]
MEIIKIHLLVILSLLWIIEAKPRDDLIEMKKQIRNQEFLDDINSFLKENYSGVIEKLKTSKSVRECRDDSHTFFMIANDHCYSNYEKQVLKDLCRYIILPKLYRKWLFSCNREE